MSDDLKPEAPGGFAGPHGWAGLAELKRQLERTGYEARGGRYRRHRRDRILEEATADGLRALAELDSALERIAREARPNDKVSGPATPR